MNANNTNSTRPDNESTFGGNACFGQYTGAMPSVPSTPRVMQMGPAGAQLNYFNLPQTPNHHNYFFPAMLASGYNQSMMGVTSMRPSLPTVGLPTASGQGAQRLGVATAEAMQWKQRPAMDAQQMKSANGAAKANCPGSSALYPQAGPSPRSPTVPTPSSARKRKYMD